MPTHGSWACFLRGWEVRGDGVTIGETVGQAFLPARAIASRQFLLAPILAFDQQKQALGHGRKTEWTSTYGQGRQECLPY